MSIAGQISFDDFEESSPGEILSRIRDYNGTFELLVPLPSIGSTQDPGNIATDYAEALTIGEMLVPLSDEIASRREYRDRSCSVAFVVTLKPDKFEEAAQLVYDLMHGLHVDDDGIWARGQVSQCEDKLYWQDPTLSLRFPDLADDYMANLLHAADIWDENPGSRKKYRKKFPETKYKYWKSFASCRFGFPLYCSSLAWVAPASVDLATALSSYAFGELRTKINFDPARFVKIDHRTSLLISEHQAAPVPYKAIKDAVRFTANVRPFGAGSSERPSWLLSRCGEVAIMHTSLGQHVGFCDTPRADSRTLKAYLEDCECVITSLRRIVGVAIHTPCEWKQLDDESFEQLCYDVVRRINQFDPSSVRKMGNSRSRDGGRDIVANTHARPGCKPRKWIIQCKLVTSKRSLSGNAMNISDTIDQYGAGGYMVFTTAVIDSTLYDKLEGIGKNRKIEQEAWSGLELERFLQGHRDLLARYFRSTAIDAQPATEDTGQ